MKRTTMLTTTAVCVLAGGLLAMGPKIKREDDNKARVELNALEGAPFAVESLASLTDWSLAQPLTAESMKNKVVLIATTSADDPQSIMMLNTLARLEREHAEDGLVILAVHGEPGFESIEEKILDGRIKVQVAKDTGGKFIEAMHVDNHPDVFLVDRAGQMRYADVSNRSIKAAVVGLLKEDAETAIANAQLEASGVEIPEPGMPEIPAELYAAADWPRFNDGNLNALNYQGKELPVALGGEQWLTEKVDLEGKVIVLDFWATWCGPCRKAMPELDRLQKKYKDELVVMGVGGQRDPIADVKKFIRSHDESYSHVYDENQAVYRAMQIRAIPHVIVLSTDGVIRWQGNPLSSSFKGALEQTIKVDPLVNALNEG
ncbi:MAG: redoxin domain-containing protein [Phycisphaerales bacterium]|nr:redoxin domain-containing protein [Phycisphaerales bacterium]